MLVQMNSTVWKQNLDHLKLVSFPYLKKIIVISLQSGEAKESQL